MATTTLEAPQVGIEMPTESVFDISSMGEGLKLKDRRGFELTTDHAADFLDYPEFIVNDEKVDRNRSEAHVIYLARAMLGGTFLWEQVNLVLCYLEGNSKPTRLNGNHTCFPAGTRIRMADGSTKRIEDVRLLDEVLTAEGRVQKVAQCHVSDHDGELVNIDMLGHKHLKCTPSHPILTRRGYVPAEELKSGDWAAMPAYMPQSSATLLTYCHVNARRAETVAASAGSKSKSFVIAGGSNHKEVPDMIQLNAGFGRLVGLYLAEGCTCVSKTRKDVVWTFCNDEEETLAADVARLAAEELGLSVRIRTCENQHVTRVEFSGILWVELMRSLCGHRSIGKRLHTDLLAGPKEFLEAVFWGWMAGDGWLRDGKRYIGATISKELALQMFDIANLLGYVPSIYHEHPQKNRAKSRHSVWKVQVRKDALRVAPSLFMHKDDGQIWRFVAGVEKEPFAGKVFNIGVEKDNSYVAEGIGVHNCWARLVAEEEGLDPKTRCPVQLLKYEAQTIEDMRRLYASLDRGKARSAGVVLNGYLAGTDEFPGLPRSALRFLAQGLGVWLWPDTNTRTLHKSDDRAFLLMKDCHKVALAVAKILQECQSIRWLRRAPTVAAMFATCAKAPAIAYDFWRDIRDGVSVHEKDDPRHVLRDWLMQSSLAKSAHSGDLQTVTQEECYRACIYRWNDYRKGRKIKRMKIDMSLERPEAQ